MDEPEPETPHLGDLRRVLSKPLRINDFHPLSALVQVEFGATSQPGLHRDHNDDHYAVLRLARHQDVIATSLQAADLAGRFDEYGYAMVVADGVGHSGGGSLASRVAVSTLAHLAVHFGNWNLRIDASTAEAVMDRATWFYERAARAVDLQSRAHPELTGMGTSLTATFSAGDDLFYAHVGNSRAYLFRDGELIQFTRDHTLDQRRTETGRPVAVPDGAYDLRYVLTDVIGGGRMLPVVDVERLRLLDHDLVLLCSSGLCAALDDEAIARVLSEARRPADLSRRLTELAASRENKNDATAVVAKYSIPPAPSTSRLHAHE